MTVSLTLAEQINQILPQTQCGKCGYPACSPYAEAIADGSANFNQCPPGGEEGIRRLAQFLQQPPLPLNPANGQERERPVAKIDENWCIGCTLCIQACPVDAIVGAAKLMHTVIPELCTGCDLCVVPCPVDCISMESATPGATGWSAWTPQQAQDARQRYELRQVRLVREQQENDARLANKAEAKLKALETEKASNEAERLEQARKKAIIAAAIERARLKQAQHQAQQDKKQTEQD